MLNDAETRIDYLNFKIVADPVAQMIIQGGDKPVSIGVSGNWGAGKSSMVGMIAESLKATEEADKYIFLDFNAWLYQGYEDARLALLQRVADELAKVVKDNTSAYEKFKAFLGRINWFKTVLATAPVVTKTAIGVASMGPIGGALAALEGIVTKVKSIKAEDLPAYVETCTKNLPDLKEYLKEATEKSMPKEIEALRNSFEKTLEALDRRLVVIVDDLDRCLPDVALPTLEAMRLLLMVNRTVFVIAADETMIRQAVRVRYGSEALDEDRVTSYFDKLIQIPVRVPRPGPNEVKCYIVLLLAELAVQQGALDCSAFSDAHKNLKKLLRKSWAGRLTREAVADAFGANAEKISEYIDIADQIAGIMTASSSIGGNPRLIKRFINNLMIRKAVSDSQEMELSFAAMVKLHLFERCAPMGAFDELASMVANSDDGRIKDIGKWESAVEEGKEPEGIPESWTIDFARQWLQLSPELKKIDLRPYIYLSREDKARFEPRKDLSPEGRNVMSLLTNTGRYQSTLIPQIRAINETELGMIFERLRDRVIAEKWSSVSMLQLLHVPMAVEKFANPYVALMSNMPREKSVASVIPVLLQTSWATPLLDRWENGNDELARRITNVRSKGRGSDGNFCVK